MAPFLQETIPEHFNGDADSLTKAAPESSIKSAEYREPSSDSQDEYEYSHLLPSFPDISWPPIREVPYHDKGLRGDPNFNRLLSASTDHFDHLPKIGTEVCGVQLDQLNDDQKDDLARLIAVRGVVVFRNQTNFSIDNQRELGNYFGTLHKHATTSVPRQSGLEDVHVVYTDGTSQDMRAVFKPSFLWHSDVSLLHRLVGISPWSLYFDR